MRQFLSNGKLLDFAGQHPQTTIEVKVRNGHHPYVEGQYVTQAAAHEISVKNYERWQDVQEVCQMLADRSGRKITKITKPVLTDTPSCQGVWTPFLNLQHGEAFAVSIQETPLEDGALSSS
jgi:large subunit ribosomal protein L43